MQGGRVHRDEEGGEASSARPRRSTAAVVVETLQFDRAALTDPQFMGTPTIAGDEA